MYFCALKWFFSVGRILKNNSLKENYISTSHFSYVLIICKVVFIQKFKIGIIDSYSWIKQEKIF